MATTRALGHVPVMANEVAAIMAPADGEVYVDGTFGRGGYAVTWLEAADCIVYGIDRDPDAVAFGRQLAARYPGRLTVLEGRFGEMDRLLAEQGVETVNGVALDLGISSPQIDDPARGFAIAADGALDMRMERRGRTAADVVNGESEAALADIFFKYGEERRARAVARAIVKARAEQPLLRTTELADLIAGVLAKGGRPGKVHPATRCFQALRVFVNSEDTQLDEGLVAAERLLAPEGRLIVVAFQSLDDRAVKTFLRQRSGDVPRASRHRPDTAPAGPPPTFRLVKRGAGKPSETEIAANPRARSARLRSAVRTAAAPWPVEAAA